MRPTPIPDEEIWEGARRIVIGPPDGDLTNDDIRPVEALVEHTETGGTRFCCRILLEPEDIERIEAGEVIFWYTQLGSQMTPWSMNFPPT